MEVPPVREGAFSPEAAYYIDKLVRKEEECNEIVAQFNKYKVKTKVRFDQLRHEISNILHEKNVDPEDEQHHPAMLLISLNETQTRLEEAEKLSLALRSDVEGQQVHINDQIILIKNLEDQLRDWEESEIARERRRNEPVDLERVQQQMMYKDERIVELNSVILDKERQILDLQESCRSASEVATSKKEAMRIVQKKFDEMERRSRREASTETDDRVTGVSFDGPTHAATTPERTQRSMQQPSQPLRPVRTSSPGRAVHVVNKNGLHSPPPLDPAELDDLPGTSQLAKTNVDGNSSLREREREKKQRKRVTFAVPQAASREDISRLTADADTDEITDALVNLTAENEILRGEVERITRMEEEMEEMAVRVAQAESAVSEAEREARHASLKARAVAQARIKELEDRMASQNALGAQQIERLQVETETLRSTRDWEVEQNARMREQLAHTKEKLRQLREELDASVQANRAAEKKLDEKEALVTSLVNELEEAESLAVFLEDQKHQILDDVDQLKDIIKLHEEQINLLEADNLIYETRVGHLREELGVSKINQRDHIKSKAFNTKLQMINKEKEQIDRKANDERLRTKALHAKVQILEAENERLMARLCEAEMAGEDTSSLDAACKQLQTRMEQAEAESSRVRTEFDARIHAAEFAADSLREECDRLRAERDAAEQNNVLLQQQQHRQLQQDQQQTHLQQLQHPPGPSKMQQLQQEDSSSSLEAALRLAQSAQETLTRERDELAERVHVLGGENFELTRRTEEAEREVQRLESEFSRLSSRLRDSSERAAAATAAASAVDAERVRREERTVEREQELIDLRARVAERESTVERIDGELKRLRAELDHAHLSMSETAAVKKEVQHLQHQLEIEREAAAAKWQQVMVQLKSYEELASNSGWDSRKTSIDETATAAAAAELRAARAEADAAAAREQLRVLQQAQQSQPHQLQHVQPVQQEVPRRAVSTEDEEESEDRHELDRLRARVEELESEVELSHELNVESGRTVQALQQRLQKAEHEKRLLESLTVEFSEDIADMKEAAAAAPVAAPETVQQASEEETDELRRKIEEMEEEASLSAELHVEMGRTVQALEGKIREMEMERRLHEMMSVELTTELHELRQLQQDQQQQSQPDAAAEVSAADAAAAAEQEAQLLQQLDEEKRQRLREQQAARDELHRLQLALHAAEDAKREVARQLAEKEQTESLVRATAATFDAVAAAAAGTSEEVVQQHPAPATDPADQEEERATLVQENVLLREAVYQNVRHSESVTSDVARLLELKEELEKAVEALRGEIWSLNGQLKASVLDRENLQDRVVELDTKLSLEKRKADLLDVELAEQVELRENAQRQAAEAENESNRRLAECAEMDGKREDLEKAYALLAGYYSQLQEAYNVLYTQQQQQAHLEQERLQQTERAEGSSREDRSTQTDATAVAASEPSTSAASVAGAAPVAVSSSSRRAMAEQYASRLAALRELSVQLTKSVLATELATLESELDNSITSIEGLSSDCPEAGASVDALFDAIIQDYDGSSSVSPDARAKIASVHAMLRAKISEVERVHSALREQRGVCTALEQRLTELEAAGPQPGIGALGSPGASSTAPSELEERIEECEALRAHVEQLQQIISRYVAREEAAAATAPTVSCRAAGCSAQLALLAARLATREADVDSLFRSNAELAHENVRLQNELDEEKGEERREEQKRETTSSSTQTHDKKDFDEAELELVKEELAAEREARKEAEKRIEATEKELAEQQQELEGTIMDLLSQQRDAASAAAGAVTAEEKEALEAKAAAVEVVALREELKKERAARVGAEKELKKKREELEEMRTEMQLKEADGDEMKQQLLTVQAAKDAAEKTAREAELQQAQLQEKVLQLQEEKKEEEDGWGSDGWGEEEPTASTQDLEQIRSLLQQEQQARAAAEEQLQTVEAERLQESQRREEEEPLQQEEEMEGDGWGEDDWGEEKKEEEPSVDAQLAAIREQVEKERRGREEAEERIKKMEEEKERKEKELKKWKEEGEEMREKLIEAEEREEEMKKELMEMKEKEKKDDKKEKEEEDGWGNDGWEEENQESSSVDQSAELAQLKLQLQQETAAKVAAEQMRDELQRLQEEQESSNAQRERQLAELLEKLQREGEEKERLEGLWKEAVEGQEELRGEIEVYEEENERLREEVAEATQGGGNETESQLRAVIAQKSEKIASLTESYHMHVEDLESQGNRVRETMILYEKIMHDKAAKTKWLEATITALETGGERPPPFVEEEDDEASYDDGYRGPAEEGEVQNALENEPEEVDYRRHFNYAPEEPDDVSVMFNKLKDFIDEAADLQDESKKGGAAAQHLERLRLRHIVNGMAELLQDLDDVLRAKTVELDRTKKQLEKEKEKRGGEEKGGEGGEGEKRVKETTNEMMERLRQEESDDDDEMEEMGREREERHKRMSTQMNLLSIQNSLLQDSETKLSECLDSANDQLLEATRQLRRMEQQLARAAAAATDESAAQIMELQRQVAALEATVNAKESQLAIALREIEATFEAKNAVELELKSFKERRKPTTGAARAANAPAATRSYVGGSRRSSAASSRNEETREEPQPHQPVRVDQAQLQQEMDFSSSTSSTLGDANTFRRRGGPGTK
ncbi:hypothetical protein PENTCL1PPCAC_5818 [Pristionchus entomophagus]|uniref:Uncharacterized protein n=1 Tax=Pristionchus entomophagus TaxID=358040 RepID=A0AAV5SKQ7_9BILA|nr:hypothetical protein PENTCL1PPCAC_5818 [Pristionchus entomophagus]